MSGKIQNKTPGPQRQPASDPLEKKGGQVSVGSAAKLPSQSTAPEGAVEVSFGQPQDVVSLTGSGQCDPSGGTSLPAQNSVPRAAMHPERHTDDEDG